MKTLTQLSNNKNNDNIVVQANSVNYLSVKQLETYLKSVSHFLSEETKNIIEYLIKNNSSYISKLSTDDHENALVGFYNSGVADTEELKDLKKWIKTVYDSGRILEIPTLLTQQQFDDIITNKIAPDIIFLDLKSEAGKNRAIKKYEPLIHKICKQFYGKSTLSYEDLLSTAYECITNAINSYGNTKNNNTDEKNESIKKYTFGQWAAYAIRNGILEEIKNFSHTVRIPISQQRKEKIETGKNTKNHTVSGNKVVKHNDEGSKTIFDFMSDTADSSDRLNHADMKRLWVEIFKELEEKFEKKIIEIFYSFYGINNYKKLKGKEIAKKYNIMPSQVTYYCVKVRNYILSNKKILNKFKEIYSIMNECEIDDNNPIIDSSI